MEVNKIFTQEEKTILFDFLQRYACCHSKHHGCYDIENESVKKVFNDNDIFKGTCKVVNDKMLSREHKNWLLFEQDKKSGTKDVAHDLMRHIRNSIAHWEIREEEGFLALEDYYKAKTAPYNISQTMDGRIEKEILFELIEALEHCKTN